jgi:uncharacterized protein
MREAPAIEAYGGGGFRIGGQRIEGSALILDDVASPWPVASLAELQPSDFDAVIAAGREAVEFVLLGLGPAMVPPPRPVREALRAAGLGLEVMETAAACKLYNVLASDGRRVAAALIAF